jgi:cobalt/nickel transport system permease protein
MPVGTWPTIGVMMALVWTAAAFSGLGIRRIFKRSLIALPFILIALPTLFTKQGEELFDLNLVIGHLTATEAGLVFFLSVMLKSWTSVAAAALLTSSTPPMHLLEALKALKLPAILVAIVFMMYRYLFVLVEEAQSLMTARKARSAGTGAKSGGSIPWRAKVTGGMAGSLFVRTMDRGERIYMAMLARGYDGRIRLSSTEPLDRMTLVATGLVLAGFAAVAVSAHLLL